MHSTSSPAANLSFIDFSGMRSPPARSAGQRLREKRQALVHPVIDTAMVVGKFLITMGNAKLVKPSHEAAGPVEQIELVVVPAIDVERLEPAQIVGLGFDRDGRVLAQPIGPAFLDDLAGVERDRQPDAEEL